MRGFAELTADAWDRGLEARPIREADSLPEINRARRVEPTEEQLRQPGGVCWPTPPSPTNASTPTTTRNGSVPNWPPSRNGPIIATGDEKALQLRICPTSQREWFVAVYLPIARCSPSVGFARVAVYLHL